MFAPILFIGVAVALFLFYIMGNNNECYWKKRGVKFYGKNKVTGVFWDFFFTKKGALFERFGDLYKEYRQEPAVGVGSMLTPSLFVIDPQNVQHILQSDFSSFHDRGIDIDTENDQLADNLLFMSGPRWKLMRQNMTPLFTGTKLKSMYYMMDRCAQDLVVYLKDNPKTWKGDCFETLMTFCNASVCASLFGIGTESIFDSPFLKVGKEVLAPTVGNNIKFILANLSPKLTKFLGLTLFKGFEALLVGAITKVVEERRKETGKRHDFAEICVKIQDNGTMRDPVTGTELEPTYGLLSAQAMFFLLAGVEPVAIVMFVTLVEIGRNPDILAKVHQEIDDKFDKYGNNITYDVISEMTYLEQVLNEAMRINPPIGILNRSCVKDTVLPVGNIKVAKGTKIITPIYHLQHDPDFYPDPEVFDPERFASGNKQRDEFYMPFGQGGRMCIGARYSKLEMAAGLAHILRNFTVRTKELGGPIKFRAHPTTVRPIDADVEFIPRNIT